MLRRVVGESRSVPIWRRLLALVALAAALLTAAQSLAAKSPDAVDTVHSNLEARLETLDSDDRAGIIVRLEAPASDAAIAALERAVGPLTVTRRFSIIDGFAATADRSQIEALARAPGVAQVEANPILKAANESAQAAFGVSKARFDLPWLNGSGVAVAVLDSGVDGSHPDLDQGKVIGFTDKSTGSDSSPAPETPFDDNGHGTHVSAIAAGEGGAAPGAAIVGVKVLNRSLQGSGGTLIDGIEWVLKNRNAFGTPIKIIVLSIQPQLGGCSDGTDGVSAAVNRAHASGLVVVVAAGNGGPAECSIGAPAAAAGALTVGAMADTSTGGFQLADFSSRGPTLDGRFKPDVVAPGVGITSAWWPGHGYNTLRGTSQAAPFVAGVAALMLQVNPGLSSQEVKDRIIGTAVDWGRGGNNTIPGSTGPDIDYGAGRLDAYAAIQAAGAPLSAPPPTPTHEVHQGSVSGPGVFVDHVVTVSDTTYPIAATLILPGAGAPDVDLALFNPAGADVASSRFVGRRQEQLSHQATTPGLYTLRVTSHSGAGTYFIDVSGATSSVPKSGSQPSITGAAREGELLRAQVGVWSGAVPFSFRNQWFRCDAAGGACGPIPGAAGGEYQLGAADVDATIRVTVTASNVAGSVSASSPATAVVAPLPPRIVVPPSIVGTARDGSTLHVERGSWASSRPLALTHQWFRCRGAGAGCTAIDGATGTSLRLGAVDIGGTVTVTVTAANAGGRESVTATPVAVRARTPESTRLPSVRGPARTGAVLHAAEGRWVGTRPLGYQLRWQRCGYDGRGCTTIAGAAGPRYVIRAGDAGRRLRVRVRASNRALPGGAARIAYSKFTGIVQPAAPWVEAGAGRVAVLTGTSRRDVIVGTPGPDIIRGLGGNDRILGRGGNDLIVGGRGRDLVLGGKGDDDLRGGHGPDTLAGGSGTDLLAGGRGKDVARAVGARDQLTGIERIR
jgi:serine protease AprX